MRARFSAGDLVQIVATGEVITISSVKEGARQTYYLAYRDGKKFRYKEPELAPYVDTESEMRRKIAEGVYANGESFQRYAYYRLFSESREGNLLSYQGNRIIFNPFQYKPLLKFLGIDSDERLLVADEVGVGKTIEAGIILDELMSRGDLQAADAVIVVCPSILCRKWQSELKTKFLLDDFYVLDGKSLTYALDELSESGRMPYPHGIVSEQLIRAERYQHMLKDCLDARGGPFLGMLIVDECHHYRNPGTNTHKAGMLLSLCSERVLMLSATPFNLRSDDLYNQLHMLDPTQFQDKDEFGQLMRQIKEVNQAIGCLGADYDSRRVELAHHLAALTPLAGSGTPMADELAEILRRVETGDVLATDERVRYQQTLELLNPIAPAFTRTLKRDALEHRVTRQTVTLEVHFTPTERDVYDTFLAASLQRYRMLGVSERAFGLILNGLERIASSSLAALRRGVDRYSHLSDADFAELISEEGEVSAADAHAMRLLLQEVYRELSAKMEGLGDVDSKYDAFRHLIHEVRDAAGNNKRVIVFSFYTETLRYLRRRLVADGYRVALMYGDTPEQTPKSQRDKDGFKVVGRVDVMGAFERGEYDILLLSEVGGEGLDFQFCSSLINYDLPYNPMRIEQRIGRIDRMGQRADKILVGSLCIVGTIDEVINRVLLARISEAEDLVGELEPIIAQGIEEINELIITGEFTADELALRERELDMRIEKARQTREAFDEARYELVNDSSFREEFEDSVRRSQITPRESMLFTQCFLKKESGCRCKPINDTSAVLHVSKDMCERMRAYLRHNGLGKAGDEIRSLIDAGGELSVDFNGDAAYANGECTFFKPAGAWIRFVVDYLRAMQGASSEGLYHASVKVGDVDGLSKGRHWVFVYEMQFKGFSDSRTFEYVVCDLDGDNAMCLSDSQKKSLFLSLANSRRAVDIGLDEFEDASVEADDMAETRKGEIVAEATTRNGIKIHSRIRAIERLSEARTRSREDDLIGASGREEERIRAAIAREQAKAAEKIAILRGRLDFVGSYALDAICLLEAN